MFVDMTSETEAARVTRITKSTVNFMYQSVKRSFEEEKIVYEEKIHELEKEREQLRKRIAELEKEKNALALEGHICLVVTSPTIALGPGQLEMRRKLLPGLVFSVLMSKHT